MRSCLLHLACLAATCTSIARSEGYAERLEAAWQALDGSKGAFELESIERVRNAHTNELREELHHVLIASEGKFSHTVDRIDTKNGNRRTLDLREVGGVQYRLRYDAPGYTDVVSTLEIREAASPTAHFEKSAPFALWPLMPFGKSLYRILREEGRLETTGDPERPVRLKAQVGDRSLEALISLAEMSPVEMTVKSDQGVVRIKVTKFALLKQRWFPVEGEGYERRTQGGGSFEQTIAYSIKRIDRSAAVPDDHFGEPPVPQGVLVADAVRRTFGYAGGPDARKEWERRHPDPSVSTGAPLVVPRRSRTKIWSTAFAISAAVFAAAAVRLRLRSRRLSN